MEHCKCDIKRIKNIWHHMLQRCKNPNNDRYKDYGGRGIKVCSQWNDFNAFYVWAMNNGYKDGLTIDRINNNGNYESINCRWATKKEQAYNKRTNRYVAINGITKTIQEWIDELGLKKSTVLMRISRGWDAVDALTKKTYELIYINGVGKNLRRWSVDTGINYQTLSDRLKRGDSGQRLIRKVV